MGLVENTVVAQVLVGTVVGCDLRNHLPHLMLWPFVHAGVARIGAYDVFTAIQQLSDFPHGRHIRGSVLGVMCQPLLSIGADMRLHAEEVQVAFLCLMDFRIALAFLILGRAGCVADGGVDNRALTQRQAFVLQVVVDGFQNPCRELMLILQVPEINDRRFFANRRTQRQSSKLTHRSDFAQCCFHGRVAQRKPVLQQVNTQHFSS